MNAKKKGPPQFPEEDSDGLDSVSEDSNLEEQDGELVGKAQASKPSFSGAKTTLYSRTYFKEEVLDPEFSIVLDNPPNALPPMMKNGSFRLSDSIEGLARDTFVLDLYTKKEHQTAVSQIGENTDAQALRRDVDKILGRPSAMASFDSTAEVSDENLQSHREALEQEKLKSLLEPAKVRRAKDTLDRDLRILNSVFNQSKKLKEVAADERVSVCTVSKICSAFRATGTVKGLEPRKDSPELPKVEQIRAFLLEQYRSKGWVSHSFKSIVSLLKTEFETLRSVSSQRILRVLKLVFRLRKLRMSTHPAKVSLDAYEEICKGLLRCLVTFMLQGCLVVFFDESSILEGGFMTKAVGTRGLMPYKRKRSEVKGLTILMAYSSQGLVSVKTSSRAPDHVCFEDFFWKTVQHLRDNGSHQNDPLIFYMDNSSIHRRKLFLQQVRDKGLAVIFGPPCTPILNAIEHAFCLLKQPFKQIPSLAAKEMIPALSSALRRLATISGSTVINMYLRQALSRLY